MENPTLPAINVARAGTQAANRFTRDEYTDAVHQLGGAAQAIGDAAAAASEITSKGNPSKVLKLGGELSAALGTLAMALPEARSIARAALVELQLDGAREASEGAPVGPEEAPGWACPREAKEEADGPGARQAEEAFRPRGGQPCGQEARARARGPRDRLVS